MSWFTRTYRWAKRRKTAIAAGVLTGGEALVNIGVPLPLADRVPPLARAVAVMALVAAAFWFRLKAQREEDGDRHP